MDGDGNGLRLRAVYFQRGLKPFLCAILICRCLRAVYFQRGLKPTRKKIVLEARLRAVYFQRGLKLKHGF